MAKREAEILASPPLPAVKAVLIGDSGVGKTALFHRFQGRGFPYGFPPTVGASGATVTITSDSGVTVPILIWDTAGQETFRGIVPLYFRDCQFLILVYDVAVMESFMNLAQWVDLARESAPPDVRIVLIANKIDRSPREVQPAEALEYAQAVPVLQVLETSALTGEGVDSVLPVIAKAALDTRLPDAIGAVCVSVPTKNHCC
jgi:small GTP-binding protein